MKKRRYFLPFYLSAAIIAILLLSSCVATKKQRERFLRENCVVSSEKEVKDTDILINTIPLLIVTASVISKLPAHTLIIDLASKPGGTDFRYAEKRGIKALLAPGLPGIVAPKTAGQILANVLAQLLQEDLRKRKGKIK